LLVACKFVVDLCGSRTDIVCKRKAVWLLFHKSETKWVSCSLIVDRFFCRFIMVLTVWE